MKAVLVNSPEGSPNFCFGLYEVETDKCLVFVQSDWDYASLAGMLGWQVDINMSVSEQLSDAFDWLVDHTNDEFEVEELRCIED